MARPKASYRYFERPKAVKRPALIAWCEARLTNVWPMCAHCRQSMTGAYAGLPRCIRCSSNHRLAGLEHDAGIA